MDKVQEILSDPDSLKQIQELADILGSDMNSFQATESQNQPFQQSDNVESYSTEQDTPFQSNDDFSQDETSGTGGFDFGMIFQLMQLFSSTSNSQDEALLLALKPYLKEERQSKVDKAIKLMKAYDIFMTAKDSGLLSNLDSIL